MSTPFGDDVRAAFTRGLIRAVGGADPVEQGIQVQVIDLAGSTADKFSQKLLDEDKRWLAQLSDFAKRSITESDERYRSGLATHKRIVDANSKWMTALEKAANV